MEFIWSFGQFFQLNRQSVVEDNTWLHGNKKFLSFISRVNAAEALGLGLGMYTLKNAFMRFLWWNNVSGLTEYIRKATNDVCKLDASKMTHLNGWDMNPCWFLIYSKETPQEW